MADLRYALALMVATCLPAHGAPETRSVTDAERTAFHTYYRQQFPDDHAEQPRFIIERATSAAPWDIAAVVDRAPQRGYRQLCRLRRLDFSYLADSRSWAMQTPPRQYAWLNPAAGCAAPSAPVQLLSRMPDTELTAILAQQGKLLDSARLLMAGNSTCARVRAYPFLLKAIDVGQGGAGPEEMVALVYGSERAGRLTVWVRRNGAEYSAWNVACGADGQARAFGGRAY